MFSLLLFISPNFFSWKLIRKSCHKIKIKRIQKLWNIIYYACLPLLYSLFRIFFTSIPRAIYYRANFYYYLYKKILHLLFLLVVCANAFFMYKWMWEFLLNLIEFLFYWFCFNDVRQRVPKEIFFENPWLTPKFMKQNSGRQLHNIFSGACLLSKHFALLMMWWRHLMCPSDPYYKCSLFKLIYYQIWTFLVLGDWSWSGNIKQDFLMISHICCFVKKR